MARMVLWLLVILVVLGCLYYGIRFYRLVGIAKGLVANTHPYELSEGSGPSMLVLGDSTAVGVGASRPEESLPGLVAHATKSAYVENHAVSGAKVRDLSGEIEKAERTSYDLILVQIGANDITRFHSPEETAKMLKEILKTLPEAKRVIVVSAGDLGAANIFPPFLRPLFTRETLAYHKAFGETLPADKIVYVDLYKAPRNHLFKEQPDIYQSADKFHPSSAGYGIWFEAVAPSLPAASTRGQ